MHDSMLTQQDEGLEHLTGEPPDEGRREACKAVGLDELVEVDAEQLGCDAEVISEVEVLSHGNDAVLLLGVLPGGEKERGQNDFLEARRDRERTHFRRLSRILTSTRAWWWKRFLLRMILTATA